MTNWKLLLRKYLEHVYYTHGSCNLQDRYLHFNDGYGSPLSADELAVLRELSEQTTESVAAEDEERRSRMWMCGLCGATYGEEVNKCVNCRTWQCGGCDAIHPASVQRCPFCFYVRNLKPGSVG